MRLPCSQWRAHFASPTGDSPFSRRLLPLTSLSASRLSHPCTNLADLMLPSLTTNSLLHSPSATSPHQARTASHSHSSKSHSLSGVIFCFPSSTSFRPLGSPASSSRSSSAMVTLLLLTLTAAFLSHPALSKFLGTWSMLAVPPTFFHNSTLPRAVSAGVPTLWPSALWIPCASAVTSTPLSRSSTLRRLLTPAGSKPLWFVSLTSVSRGFYGTSSPISCVGTQSQSASWWLCLFTLGRLWHHARQNSFSPFFSIF